MCGAQALHNFKGDKFKFLWAKAVCLRRKDKVQSVQFSSVDSALQSTNFSYQIERFLITITFYPQHNGSVTDLRLRLVSDPPGVGKVFGRSQSPVPFHQPPMMAPRLSLLYWCMLPPHVIFKFSADIFCQESIICFTFQFLERMPESYFLWD